MLEGKPTLEYGTREKPRTRWWLIAFLLLVGVIAVVRALVL
jgi:hypothetical protein